MERAGARMQGRCVRHTLRQQQLELTAAALLRTVDKAGAVALL